MKNFTIQARRKLGKRRMSLVEDIAVMGEAYEVVLKPPYGNRPYGLETMWVFGQHNLIEYGGDMTASAMWLDLLGWFDDCEDLGTDYPYLT